MEMSTDRRLTTDRFFGGAQRLRVLAQFLSFIHTEQPAETAASKWIRTYINASSPAAVSRHLTFLETIGLIESVESALQLDTAGEKWLATQADRVLFDALHANVAGFEIILEAVQERPRTDDELMAALNDSGPFDMESPGVAARHREWLEVLGYVERSGSRTQLTTAGAVLLAEITDTDTATEAAPEGVIGEAELPERPMFEIGQRYDRRALHEVYGGQRYRGIATPADTAVVFLFTGEAGEDHGYDDSFQSDGTFVYTGEGREGDMTMDGGNIAIRDHQLNGDELHLFKSTADAWVVEYSGQFKYVDHWTEQLPDTNGDLREGIRFELAPVGAVTAESK